MTRIHMTLPANPPTPPTPPTPPHVPVIRRAQRRVDTDSPRHVRVSNHLAGAIEDITAFLSGDPVNVLTVLDAAR